MRHVSKLLALLVLGLSPNMLPAQQTATRGELGAPTEASAQPAQASVLPSATPVQTPDLFPVACGSGHGFVAGGTFYYLKPYAQNNTAYITTINPGQPNSQVVSDSFRWNFDPTFAGWVGWTSNSGLGVRARYFQFDDSSQTANLSNGITPAPGTQTTINPPLSNFLPLSTGGTAFGSPGTLLNTGLGKDHLTFASDLRIHAIDLELTYEMKTCFGVFLASGGGRYLNLEQGYHASLSNDGGGAGISESQTFDSRRYFNGAGPTLALQWNLPVRGTGLSFFASARGSMLVGSLQENVSFSQTVNDPNGLIPGHIVPPAVLQINPTSSRFTDSVMPTAELELGLEYGRAFGHTYFFVRGAAVSQTYFDAGNASQSTGNLCLFGVQGSVGIKY